MIHRASSSAKSRRPVIPNPDLRRLFHAEGTGRPAFRGRDGFDSLIFSMNPLGACPCRSPFDPEGYTRSPPAKSGSHHVSGRLDSPGPSEEGGGRPHVLEPFDHSVCLWFSWKTSPRDLSSGLARVVFSWRCGMEA